MDILNYGNQMFDIKKLGMEIIDEFLDLYSNRPVKNNKGGMLSPHMFWTWYVIKTLSPKYIIESGIYKGQGTWLMQQACPDAKIYSIDPELGQRVYYSQEVTYFSDDFSLINWNDYLDPTETLCFFDDHQNAYLRLQQMKWMGFRHAMFEDNYPANQGDCYSLKKVFSEKGFRIAQKKSRSFKNRIRMRFHEKSMDDTKMLEVKANAAHAYFALQNIESYTTFPPLIKNENTRWGDKWEGEGYLTPPPILSQTEKAKYDILKEEAYSYTWICYVKLKYESLKE